MCPTKQTSGHPSSQTRVRRANHASMHACVHPTSHALVHACIRPAIQPASHPFIPPAMHHTWRQSGQRPPGVICITTLAPVQGPPPFNAKAVSALGLMKHQGVPSNISSNLSSRQHRCSRAGHPRHPPKTQRPHRIPRNVPFTSPIIVGNNKDIRLLLRGAQAVNMMVNPLAPAQCLHRGLACRVPPSAPRPLPRGRAWN